jgi:hypothetical protein
MLIRGEANGASIELSDSKGLANRAGTETYRVTLRENGLEATINVYAFDPSDNGLSKFFAELAENWKGWKGVKKWSSLEGEFELECSHDGLGHIGTTATIYSNLYGNGWTAQIRFDIENGQLDEIVAGIGRFFTA